MNKKWRDGVSWASPSDDASEASQTPGSPWEMEKMAKNGKKWRKMEKNGEKWRKMEGNGGKWGGSVWWAGASGGASGAGRAPAGPWEMGGEGKLEQIKKWKFTRYIKFHVFLIFSILSLAQVGTHPDRYPMCTPEIRPPS